jgi:hypothetical protein
MRKDAHGVPSGVVACVREAERTCTAIQYGLTLSGAFPDSIVAMDDDPILGTNPREPLIVIETLSRCAISPGVPNIIAKRRHRFAHGLGKTLIDVEDA